MGEGLMVRHEGSGWYIKKPHLASGAVSLIKVWLTGGLSYYLKLPFYQDGNYSLRGIICPILLDYYKLYVL